MISLYSTVIDYSDNQGFFSEASSEVPKLTGLKKTRGENARLLKMSASYFIT